MNFMNEKEAVDFFNGLELDFSNYHKGTFTFEGEKDGKLIYVDYSFSNPFRAEFNNTDIFVVDMQVDSFRADMYAGSEVDKIGKELYTFSFEY